MDRHSQNKTLIAPFLASMKDYEEQSVRGALTSLFADDAIIHMCHPFGDHVGPDAFYSEIHAPLLQAMPDMERRDWIVMAGSDEQGNDWVGCGGHYMGTFVKPFLDIQPTGHLVHMRFHEFYKFEDGKVTEFQAIWDIPELMLQAGAWPMVPSLGREFCIPGPSTQDGLVPPPYDAATSEESKQHIIDMLTALVRHPVEPVEAMELQKFWHEKMNWYGPAGIGTGRGTSGFRNWHQIPFLNGMPDRGQYPDEITHHFFGDGNYAAVTGWPDMMQTIAADGWLGLPPIHKKIAMRSLDFWRLETCPDGKKRIRENWVLVDLLHMYDQIGVDVLGRMQEFNKAKLHVVPDQKAFAS